MKTCIEKKLYILQNKIHRKVKLPYTCSPFLARFSETCMTVPKMYLST